MLDSRVINHYTSLVVYYRAKELKRYYSMNILVFTPTPGGEKERVGLGHKLVWRRQKLDGVSVCCVGRSSVGSFTQCTL